MVEIIKELEGWPDERTEMSRVFLMARQCVNDGVKMARSILN